MPHNVIVLGAGADKTPGIDFPLAADLLPAISGYLRNTEDGKRVEALLRGKIPNLSFRFDKFINSAITEIAHREPDQLRSTIQRVHEATQHLPDTEEHRPTKKLGALIEKLLPNYKVSQRTMPSMMKRER